LACFQAQFLVRSALFYMCSPLRHIAAQRTAEAAAAQSCSLAEGEWGMRGETPPGLHDFALAAQRGGRSPAGAATKPPSAARGRSRAAAGGASFSKRAIRLAHSKQHFALRQLLGVSSRPVGRFSSVLFSPYGGACNLSSSSILKVFCDVH